MLLYNLAISAITVLLFGLAPALRATRSDLATVLKNQGSAVAGGGQGRWRRMLVVAQVSLSLPLLISAGLFGNSLRNLRQLSPGFDTSNLVSFSVDPTLSGYQDERSKLLYKQLTRELAALPGVESSALGMVPPLTWDYRESDFTVEGHVAKPAEETTSRLNYVSPGYFSTLAIPLYSGRDFRESDAKGAPRVAIVNEKFARYYFAGSEAVGRRLGRGTDPGNKLDIVVVGVVRDTNYLAMKEPIPRQVYFPYLQSDADMMTAYIRTSLGPDRMFPALRRVVQRLAPDVPVYQMKTVARQKDDSLCIERLAATLSTSFSALATALAGVGLYGVMAFLVARRTREIGIRIALGASGRDVVWLVVRDALLLIVIGVSIGLPVAIAGTRLVANQLYGVQGHDPFVVFTATLGMAALGAAATFAPARRAMRVSPIDTLRYE